MAKLGALLIFVLGLLLWPYATEPRDIVPYDLPTVLELGPRHAVAPVVQGAPLRFKVAIKPDLAEEGREVPLAEVAKLTPAEWRARLEKSFEAHPYRFPKALAIAIGTHARKNKCELVLHLEGIGASRPVGCRGLIDNAPALFEFEERLAPGVYDATLVSDAASEASGVSPYVAIDKDGGTWIVAQSGASGLTAASMLLREGRSDPRSIGLYLGLAAALVVMILWPTAHSVGLVAAILLIFGGTTLITPPLAGHDETAHVDMLARQLIAEKVKTNRERKQHTRDFYQLARDEMLDGDFFRLHRVGLPPKVTCPHEILHRCGSSPMPMSLYAKYASLVPAAERAVRLQTLDGITGVGRFFNAAWMIGVPAVILLLAGRRWSWVAVLLAGLCAGVLSTAVSVTNDMPMVMLGLFGAVVLGFVLAEKPSWRSWLLVLAYGAWLGGFARQVDRSWIAGIAPFGLALLALCLRTAHKVPAVGGYGSVRRGVAFAGAGFAGGALLFAAAAGVLSIRSVRLWAHKSFPDLKYLTYVYDIQPMQALRFMRSHVESLIGTFQWGRLHVDGWVYAAIGGVLLCATLLGLIEVTMRCGKRAHLILAGLGAVLAVHLLTVFAAAGSFVTLQDYPDAIGKMRLTAPGIASLLALAAVGFATLWKSEHWRRRFQQIVAAFGLVLLLHYLPLFYIAELY